MSALVVLSIACAAFIAGTIFCLMILALVRNHYDDDMSGAPEGDQTTKFSQRYSSSQAAD
jgi:hypothetical protein